MTTTETPRTDANVMNASSTNQPTNMNSQTDTPRTDAIAHYCRVGIPITGIDENDILSVYVPIINARELERELAASKAEVADLKQALEIANRSADDLLDWKISNCTLRAEVERLRANLRRAVEIAVNLSYDYADTEYDDELDLIKATFNQEKK